MARDMGERGEREKEREEKRDGERAREGTGREGESGRECSVFVTIGVLVSRHRRS